MKKSLLTIVFGSALFLAACGGDDSSSSTNNSSTTPDGEKITMQTCATCHGGKLQGASGPALNAIGSKYTEEEILNIIKNGTNKGMPAGLLKGTDAEAAAAYLAGLK